MTVGGTGAGTGTGGGKRQRLLRFVTSGVINTGVDFAVFSGLILLAGVRPFAANLVAFAAAVTCSFLLNRFWTFGDRRTGSPLRFVLWMAAIALVSSWVLDRMVGMGLPVAVAKIAVTLMVMVFSFQVMNRLVFNAGDSRLARFGGGTAFAAASALNLLLPASVPASGLPQSMLDLYAEARDPQVGPRHIYHLGHSLVGRDMPAMLAQLAGDGHRYGLQLGWGTSLNQHLTGREAINGFEVENASPHFRPLSDALDDQTIDALVFTEMIGLRAAIRYHDSPDAVTRLVTEARRRNPDLRFYLYETWHPLDDSDDWLGQIPDDWRKLWQPYLLAPAIRAAKAPVRVIPAGTVVARLVAEVEATPGGVGGMTQRTDLFFRSVEGVQDMIHLSDIGLYLVALTHYAVLYDRPTIGLPYQLARADGTPADAPSAELAALMQRLVDEVVQTSPLSR